MSGDDAPPSGAMTLKEAFSHGMKLHTKIEQSSADSNDAEKQALVKECAERFEELWRSVDAAGVFSRNEGIEEVATQDIRFFLVLYYLGDLMERKVDTNRTVNLRNAVRCFQLFMDLCANYSILPEDEFKQLTSPIDPTNRAARIERLKKQKELQAKLAEMSERKKLLSRRISEETAGRQETEREECESEFDAAERSYWLLAVADKLRTAAQQLHMSTRELEMLTSLTQEQKQQAVEEYQQQISDQRGRKPHPSQLTRIEAPEQPMIVTQLPMDRERILSEVFMDRNPPTMSDAEYARQQMERMQAPQDEKKENSDSEDEEVVERKRIKASNWDDWKDDHARDGNMGANIG